jgi:hypothetical protein
MDQSTTFKKIIDLSTNKINKRLWATQQDVCKSLNIIVYKCKYILFVNILLCKPPVNTEE